MSENTSDIVIDDDLLVNSDNLTLSLLVCSSTNLTVIFIYWTYLLYSSFTLKTTWHHLFPHFILLGQFLGSSSSLAYIVIDPISPTSCIISLLIPISYSLIYSIPLSPSPPSSLVPHPSPFIIKPSSFTLYPSLFILNPSVL